MIENIQLRAVIERLFREAPKVADSDTPAIECHVVLRTGQQLQGALSESKEGTLKMLSPNEQVERTTGKRRLVMVETFFAYAEVSCIAIVREVTVDQKSNLIHTAG